MDGVFCLRLHPFRLGINQNVSVLHFPSNEFAHILGFGKVSSIYVIKDLTFTLIVMLICNAANVTNTAI